MSGLAAPSLTTRPTLTIASFAQASARNRPSFTRASMAGTGISTMSGVSPWLSFCCIALITM